MTFLLSNTNNLYTHQPSPSAPPCLSAWLPSQPAAAPRNLVVKSGLLFPLFPSSLNTGPGSWPFPVSASHGFPSEVLASPWGGGCCRTGLPPPLASCSPPTLSTCQLFEHAVLSHLRAFACAVAGPESVLCCAGRTGSFSSFSPT